MGLNLLRCKGVEAIGRFYSIYRAIVIDNEDPLNLNRLLIHVPDITNNNVWAFPKHQPGSNGYGAKYLTPQKDEIVYVEFQTGDPQYPIWSFHGWAETQVPDDLKGTKVAGFITPNGNKVKLDDVGNIVEIEINGNQKIKIHPDGINLSVEGTLEEIISGDPGNYVKKVAGDSSEEVTGDSEEIVHQNKYISVEGEFSTQVEGDNILTVSGDSLSVVDGSTTIDSSGDVNISSDSNVKIDSLINVEITATGGVIINGTAAIDITSVGPVSISGSTLALSGGTIALSGGGSASEGVPMTSSLVTQLNNIENEINTLKALFATVPTTPMDGGAAAFASLATSWGTPLPTTSAGDIENPDITQ